MTPIDIEELKKVLPKLINENDEIKGVLIRILSGVVATKEDIKNLIEFNTKRFEQMDKRFEQMQAQMDKRFEQMDKRFEQMQAQMDKRFEQMQAQMDKRFEQVDKRFEQVDKRFEQVDKRFEQVDKRFDNMDTQFSEVKNALKNIQAALGKPYEQFARNVISRILDAEGLHKVKLIQKTLPDPDGEVYPKTKEVEIDGFSLEPPVIIEVTTILRDLNKIKNFIKKKKFVEKRYNRRFRAFFVASSSELDMEHKAKAEILCRKNEIEFINL
ncbi:MAG: hypothetical protein ACTSXT_09015 [Candidatus Helarchaeota archaeon]